MQVLEDASRPQIPPLIIGKLILSALVPRMISNSMIREYEEYAIFCRMPKGNSTSILLNIYLATVGVQPLLRLDSASGT